MGYKKAVQGNVQPLKDKILVYNMNFGMEVSKGGIVMPSTDGKSEGVKPRWGQVWATGPDQKEVMEGEWILIEHGRWTRKFEIETDEGKIAVHGVDNNAILLVSDEKPNENLSHRFD